MMLRHLGEQRAADELERAIATVLDEGSVLTPDLGGTAVTGEVTDAICAALDGAR